MLQNITSKSILNRLPIYLEYCTDYLKNNPETIYISSKKIANELSLGEVQVRKDLFVVSGNGRPKKGYSIMMLTENIKKYLGVEIKKKGIIVGVGKLGSALIGFNEFSKYGFEIVAGFDVLNKEEINNITIKEFNEKNLKKVLNLHKIDIAIICTPKEVAQKVCDLLVENNISAIWNFVPVRLKVPSNVLVQNENLSYSVSILSSLIK